MILVMWYLGVRMSEAGKRIRRSACAKRDLRANGYNFSQARHAPHESMYRSRGLGQVSAREHETLQRAFTKPLRLARSRQPLAVWCGRWNVVVERPARTLHGVLEKVDRTEAMS